MKKIELSDRAILETLMQSQKNLCCEYSFPNLFVWGSVYDTKWTLDNEKLYILYGSENCLLMPIPEPTLDELLKIPEKFALDRKTLNISHTPENYIKTNPDIHNYFEVIDDDDFIDYVHLIERLSELKGSKLAKKKNLISQFIRNYPDYECRPIDSEIKNHCLLFAEEWRKKQENNHIGLEHEYIAIKNALKFFDELALEGLAIFANSKLCAFSIFSRQNDETYIEHFEKADPLIKGSAQIINRETAKFLKGKAKYLNREQDIGIPGLRKAKSSYDPDIRIGGKNIKFK